MIHKFINEIISCNRIRAESNLVNAFREFLHASLERGVTRLGL